MSFSARRKKRPYTPCEAKVDFDGVDTADADRLVRWGCSNSKWRSPAIAKILRPKLMTLLVKSSLRGGSSWPPVMTTRNKLTTELGEVRGARQLLSSIASSYRIRWHNLRQEANVNVNARRKCRFI